MVFFWTFPAIGKTFKKVATECSPYQLVIEAVSNAAENNRTEREREKERERERDVTGNIV